MNDGPERRFNTGRALGEMEELICLEKTQLQERTLFFDPLKSSGRKAYRSDHRQNTKINKKEMEKEKRKKY